jgi:hypothetical protein
LFVDHLLESFTVFAIFFVSFFAKKYSCVISISFQFICGLTNKFYRFAEMDGIQPESRRGLTPLIKTPFVDRISFPSAQQRKFYFLLLNSASLDTICAWFEAQFYRCLEAYGSRLGRIHCDLEHRDLTECTTGDKQVCFFV